MIITLQAAGRNSDGPNIKVFPDLGAAALRQRSDREYRLWSIARTVDARGSGRVAVADLQEWLDANKVRGTKPDTLKRLLQGGDGVWWRLTRDGKWLYLRSQEQVSAALGLPIVRKNPVITPAEWVVSLKVFRAAIHVARFAGDEFSNPISRGVITELVGYSRRTQQNWERALGDTIEKRSNSIETSLVWEPGDEEPEGHYVTLVNGRLRVVRRLPQSYRAALLRARRGRMRKVNRFLRRHSRRQGKGPESALGLSALAMQTNADQGRREHRQREKLFYYDRRAAKGRWDQKVEGDQFYLAVTDKFGRPVTARDGSQLWQEVRVVNGEVLFSEVSE